MSDSVESSPAPHYNNGVRNANQQSQGSSQVSPDPQRRDDDDEMFYDEQECQSEQESIVDVTHQHSDAGSAAAKALESLPAKAFMPVKPKEPLQRLTKGKVCLPSSTKVSKHVWINKLNDANTRNVNLESFILQASQTTQTLYASALQAVDHQYSLLTKKHSALIRTTREFAALKVRQTAESALLSKANKNIASLKSNLKRKAAKKVTADKKLAKFKLKEQGWIVERKELKKKASEKGHGNGNKREDMIFKAELDIHTAEAKLGLQCDSKKAQKNDQLKSKNRRYDDVRTMFQRGDFVSKMLLC